MFSDEWDWYGNGMCLFGRYKALCRSIGVCSRHRYDEDDEGMTEEERNALMTSQNL